MARNFLLAYTIRRLKRTDVKIQNKFCSVNFVRSLLLGVLSKYDYSARFSFSTVRGPLLSHAYSQAGVPLHFVEESRKIFSQRFVMYCFIPEKRAWLGFLVLGISVHSS